MKNYDSFTGLHIHFVGIGGISMSGLAQIVLSRDGVVSGSDLTTNKEIERLKSLGASVYYGHSEENIASDIDLVVYTSAVSKNNPELIRAQKLDIPTMERSEFLGIISKSFKKVIAVSGTHGKTTTASMIAEILTYAGLNPTIHLGGESVGLRGNTIIGNNEYFIVEACEYKESFRFLNPYIALITNIEADHLDYYKDYQDIRNAFLMFASRSQALICLDADDITHSNQQVVFKDWKVKQIEFIANGYNFNVYFKDLLYGSFRINMLGRHNIINALFAIATAKYCGVDVETIIDALASFKGVERRYETIYKFDSGCRVIIDYAHHPTEIKSSIEGLKDVYKRTLYVFQPHTYSRTIALFDDFIDVLRSLCDLVLFDTYPARENTIVGGRAEDLYNSLCDAHNLEEKTQQNKIVEYFDSVECLTKYINYQKDKFDCILVLGAGDLAEKLKRKYNNA